jgi:hypothetical protein
MKRSLLLAVAFAAVLVGCNAHTSETKVQAAPLPDSELRELTEAEKKQLGPLLAATLKDPESAKFIWTKVPKQMPSTFHYCGMVNAKNSYGGYTGAHPFLAVISTDKNKIVVGSIAGVGGTAIATKVVEDQCAEHGLNPYRV